MKSVRPEPVGQAGAIPSLRVMTGSPWLRGQAPAVVQEWPDVEGRIVAWGGVQGDRWVMDWPGLGTYRFGVVGDVEVFPVAGASLYRLEDSFVRGVLPVVLVGREHEALHGSAVLADGRVAAFCARSGVGKSSLALGLAARGTVTHWADDAIVLAVGADTPQSLSLPFPARVDEEARRALGLPPPPIPVPPGRTAPLSRVYLLDRDPALDPGEPVITDVTSARTFEGILTHAHSFELGGPSRMRRMVERLIAIAGRVRVCDVRFAPSLDALPALVASIERHLTTG